MSNTTRLVVGSAAFFAAVSIVGSIQSQQREEAQLAEERRTEEAAKDRVQAEKSRRAALTPEQRAAEEAEKARLTKEKEDAAVRAKAAEDARVAEVKRQAAEAEAKRSDWTYSDTADKVSGKTIKNAGLRSENLEFLAFPYSGGTRGNLQIRRHPRFGTDVIFYTSNGQVQCNAYSSCKVHLRVDDKLTMSLSGNPPEDHDPTVVFLNKSVIGTLRKSSKVVLTVSMFQEGERSFEFRTRNLDWK
ncbi:hypothetical protein [Aromatoleum anaerobium]|uniref:Uncharacterized protein n=1 Tax=Aromatoleum anaerobium TaxID=182180 RepID=A0ABX1PIK9_9RHOO|nr:hypothetical protein [Aromatoleum anaerobium]MCK0508420.1 hypothetical protein [Aromatoleum anaerobium]